MNDPVAIITGAGRGIGRATAQVLASAGYRLCLTSRTAAELAETAALAPGSLALPGDVTDPAHVAALVSRAAEYFGRIDALVNNAGYTRVIPVSEMDLPEFRRVIDTNLTAAFTLCRAVWPTFVKQGAGVIVNVTSPAARDPFPGLGAYGAAKAALNTLALALAREGHPHGIRVHTVSPSATETGMFRQILTEAQYPPEQTLAPADVARVILQCLRGDLRYTSGEVIPLHKTV